MGGIMKFHAQTKYKLQIGDLLGFHCPKSVFVCKNIMKKIQNLDLNHENQ